MNEAITSIIFYPILFIFPLFFLISIISYIIYKIKKAAEFNQIMEDIKQNRIYLGNIEHRIKKLHYTVNSRLYNINSEVSNSKEIKPVHQKKEKVLKSIVRYCQYCGMNKIKDVIFCHKCGNVIEIQSIYKKTNNDLKERREVKEYKNCVNCKIKNEWNSTFCIFCGCKL